MTRRVIRHNSPAVNEEGLLVAVGVSVPYSMKEVEEGCGMSWDTKIRPRDEV